MSGGGQPGGDAARLALLPGGFGGERARLWVALCAASRRDDSAGGGGAAGAPANLRGDGDDDVVAVDVARSVRHLRLAASESDIAAAQAAVARVLRAAAATRPHYYYQGLHDVAAVLAHVLGEAHAAGALATLTGGPLAPYARAATMDAAGALTDLLVPLVRGADPELGAHLEGAGVTGVFAVPWFLTLFAHNVGDMAAAARLFDVWLSHDASFVVYVSAAVRRGAGVGGAAGPQTIDVTRAACALPSCWCTGVRRCS